MNFSTRLFAILPFTLPALALGCAPLESDDADLGIAESAQTGTRTFAYESTIDYGRKAPALPASASVSERFALERLLPKGNSTNERARLLLSGSLKTGAKATDVAAYLSRSTAGEGGGPGTEIYSCTTRMRFEVGAVRTELVDDARGSRTTLPETPIFVDAYFSSPAHAHSNCQVHRYPSFERKAAGGGPEQDVPLALADGTTLSVGRSSIGVPIRFRAVASDGSYRIDQVSMDRTPDAFARLLQLTVSWSRVDGNERKVATGSSVLREVPFVQHQLVRSIVRPQGCGAPNARAEFFFSYARQVPAGARVFVRYTASDTLRGAREEWRDDREVELQRDPATGDFRGAASVPVRVLGKKSVASQLGSAFAFSPVPLPADLARMNDNFTTLTDSLKYVYRIQQPNGQNEFDNGSSARWGHYELPVSSHAFIHCASDDSFAVEHDFEAIVFKY